MGDADDDDFAQPPREQGLPAHRAVVVEPGLRQVRAVQQQPVHIEEPAAAPRLDAADLLGQFGMVGFFDVRNARHEVTAIGWGAGPDLKWAPHSNSFCCVARSPTIRLLPEGKGAMPQTLFDKIWDAHLVARRADGRDLIYIDRHVLHDLHAPHAFAKLAKADRGVRRPDLTFSCLDHTVSTKAGRTDETNPDGAAFLRATRDGSRRHGIRVFDLGDPDHGISHVVAPELGMVLPGATHAVPDSHACTVGGLGALAFGCGTTRAGTCARHPGDRAEEAQAHARAGRRAAWPACRAPRTWRCASSRRSASPAGAALRSSLRAQPSAASRSRAG